MRSFSRWVFLFALVSLCGCGDPTTYQVTGRVTMGGQPYDRLMVYMRPVSATPDRFSQAVGSTDKTGTLSIDSSAGGLQPGVYRVTFSYRKFPGNSDNSKAVTDRKVEKGVRQLGPEDKIEMVPPPYDDETSKSLSPVEFEVTSADENRFDFDIPNK